MVGVVTSNKCASCRRRKKKCDEKRPACSPCIRGGWPCPGYQAQWKFVDESPRLKEQYARRRYVYDAVDESLETLHARYVDEGMRSDGMLVVQENLQFLRYSRDQSCARTWVPRYLEVNRLGSEFVFCLETHESGMLLPLRLMGSFLEYIPTRLGQNTALDDTIACICAVYHGRLATSYYADKRVRQAYVKALSSVRGQLMDSNLRMQPEILCASILIQFCELALGEGTTDWTQLARGTALLVYARGVERYKSDFELSMLHSQLSYIVAQSMAHKERCFLSNPEWRPLITDLPKWPKHKLTSRSFTLRSKLCVLLSDMPGLFLDHLSLEENPRSSDVLAPELVQRVFCLLHGLKEWRQDELGRGVLEQCAVGDGQYPDIVVAVSDTVGNSMLCSLDRILRSLCSPKARSFVSPELRRLIEQALDDTATTFAWRQNAIAAFKTVQTRSPVAAKPLEMGVEQLEAAAVDVVPIPLR
ncbi:hypothetical protein BJ875DRAFT_166932 [Amylocarpus encephaloides]|uniref:Zn(2)-C6 fungal-type domain-containing protein n=1 Tax=Amylocarpus encephaloides TaxID=45428 RepID=A0A9P8C198_9HELO|nr:hypothetical protein BJ875DRAFT_166932 [Amylocarpus encephaloides]